MELLPGPPDEALYRRVYRTLREAILSGELPAGRRVPSSRHLAAEWRVARNTVIEAVDLLIAEGYLTARPASGTYVAPRVAAEPRDAAPGGPPLRLTAWARRALAEPPAQPAGPFDVDFRVGAVPTELFPSEAWAQALSARARELRAGGHADELGPPVTREALVAYLARERGVQASPDMLMLTSGSQGSLDVLARVLVEPGRIVAVEDPGYAPARRVFEAAGAQVVPVPVDGQGLIPSALPRDAALLYVTPAHQFPTGAVLPAGRRLAVLEWAERAGAWVLEDDYNSEFRFGSRPLTALQGLAPHAVVHVGTFSKSLAPALRSGYLVAPRRLVRTLAAARALTDRHPPVLDALALADLLESGQYARHLRRVKALVQDRAGALQSAIVRHLPDWRPALGEAGLHLHAALPSNLTEQDLLAAAARAHVGVNVTSQFAVLPHAPGVLLNFAHLPEADIEKGVRLLARVLAPQPR